MRYGTTEERRRTAALAREVIEYKDHYRDHTELVVHLAGDIIQGRLHDIASAAPVAEQVTRAIYLLTSFLRRCAAAYPKVSVYCTPGNHGRIKDRHPSRAVNQKWDSFENIIYEAVRIAMHDAANVSFVIPKTPFYEYALFGMRGFVTHGDTVLNPGYPGKAVNVAKLESQALKLMSARGDYRLIAVGHVHVPSVVHLPSTVLVTNGALIPTDEYGTSIGVHSTACVQQLWETVPNYMFGDHRMLNFTAETDKDTSLDAIIPSDK
jgi:DNA repair exonuclease SbcCD nuclease subunit